jgi:hypothetical protein
MSLMLTTVFIVIWIAKMLVIEQRVYLLPSLLLYLWPLKDVVIGGLVPPYSVATVCL